MILSLFAVPRHVQIAIIFIAIQQFSSCLNFFKKYYFIHTFIPFWFNLNIKMFRWIIATAFFHWIHIDGRKGAKITLCVVVESEIMLSRYLIHRNMMREDSFLVGKIARTFFLEVLHCTEGKIDWSRLWKLWIRWTSSVKNGVIFDLFRT